MNRLLMGFTVLLIVVLSSCTTEPDPIVETPQTMPGGTPESTMSLLISAYRSMDTTLYRALFTSDFEFEFSPTLDDDLARQYFFGWSLYDETLAAGNLFHGGIGVDGQLWPGATAIELLSSNNTTQGDTTSGRDTTKYRVLKTGVFLRVDTPPPP